MAREMPQRFLVAFSFAGEQRDLVRSVAEAVEKILGEGTVFFDEWFEAYLAGFDGDTKLQEIYTKRTALVIVCVSERWGDKPWTQMEHEAIRELVMRARASKDKTDRLRVLPVRVDKGEVEGIPFNAILPDIRNKTVQQSAELIVDRLKLTQRRIYLATCTPDIREEWERMKACLEDLGWSVLSNSDDPDGHIKDRLREDLKNSLAFVQLLGPTPWKPEELDRIQNQTALDLKLPRFRYRSPEIDLAAIDKTHRDFLTAADVIEAGFEDFKVYLEKELKILGHQLEKPVSANNTIGNPPLVRVIIRSPNPEPLWERAFYWIDQEQMLTSQVSDGENLEERHLAEPCQGFLVICDAHGLEDGPHSPRRDMEQCRQIQLKEKNPAQRPAVGLVYWPPPSDPLPWAKLLRSTPHKLYRVLGEELQNLSNFFAEVRRVSR